VEPVQDDTDVVGQGVGGGDGLVSGLDLDGVVAAQPGDELLDRPVGELLEPAGDGEGGEHDSEVGLDRVAFVVVDRPRAQIGLGHAEALLDLPQLVVSAHHVLRGRGFQVGDVALQPGQRPGLGFEVAVHALGGAGELHEPVPLHRRLPGDSAFAIC
jgi:hypothetical protein